MTRRHTLRRLMSLEERQSRYLDMKLKYDRGMTHKEIGAEEDPPLTKQRVQDILNGGMPRANGRPRKVDAMP